MFCLVHVDLSLVPPRYLEFARLYLNTINLHITDIRKTSYSRNRVMRGDGYDGPVIVKSSLNSAGEPERYGRPRRLRRIWDKFNRELTRRAPPGLPFQQPSITSKQHYRVFPKRRLLPVGWPDRDDIVVELFSTRATRRKICAARMVLLVIGNTTVVKYRRIPSLPQAQSVLRWRHRRRMPYGSYAGSFASIMERSITRLIAMEFRFYSTLTRLSVL